MLSNGVGKLQYVHHKKVHEKQRPRENVHYEKNIQSIVRVPLIHVQQLQPL